MGTIITQIFITIYKNQTLTLQTKSYSFSAIKLEYCIICCILLFTLFPILHRYYYRIKYCLYPSQVALLVEAPCRTPKRFRVWFPVKHIPRLWGQSPVGAHMGGYQSMFPQSLTLLQPPCSSYLNSPSTWNLVPTLLPAGTLPSPSSGLALSESLCLTTLNEMAAHFHHPLFPYHDDFSS